jgi:hypothetical protein
MNIDKIVWKLVQILFFKNWGTENRMVLLKIEWFFYLSNDFFGFQFDFPSVIFQIWVEFGFGVGACSDGGTHAPRGGPIVRLLQKSLDLDLSIVQYHEFVLLLAVRSRSGGWSSEYYSTVNLL